MLVGAAASHLDIQWQDPETARAWRRYASSIDLDAALSAVGVERVALIAVGDGGLCAT